MGKTGAWAQVALPGAPRGTVWRPRSGTRALGISSDHLPIKSREGQLSQVTFLRPSGLFLSLRYCLLTPGAANGEIVGHFCAHSGARRVRAQGGGRRESPPDSGSLLPALGQGKCL